MIFNKAALSFLLTVSLCGVDAQQRKFKNVIMMIPDGCDDGVLGLARWYKNENLFVDTLRSGTMHPYMANSLMTDSAPGGTAFSTGKLTTDKFIAVGPRREDLLSNVKEHELWTSYAPIPTNLEAAKAMGMSTGLASTSRITHATPASFAAHVDSRSKEQEIAKQMVFNNIDVVMGGGRKNMLPAGTCPTENRRLQTMENLLNMVTQQGQKTFPPLGLCEGDCDSDDDCKGELVCFQHDGNTEIPGCGAVSRSKTDFCVEPPGAREDCLNLEDELVARGYDLCYTRHDMMTLDDKPNQKAWCSFASSHMSPDIDRKHFAETEPSLAEMTEKMIDILSKNPEGFFMTVEGSQVDWAGHANDPIWMVTDFIAWDDAVKVAVDFAAEDGETLVLALPDHNTGGLKVGNYKHDYLDRTVEFAREPLLGMKMTSGGVVRKMEIEDGEEATAEDLKASVAENWGISITNEDAQNILEYSETYSDKYNSFPGSTLPLNYALSRIISEEYTIAGWESHGHNGEDVPMWVYGMEPHAGVMLNTDVGKMVDSALGGGLSLIEDDLYVDLDTTGLSYSVDLSDVTHQHAVVEGFVFPINTDYFLNGDTRVTVPGITIYAPKTEKLYISTVAIKTVQSMN